MRHKPGVIVLLTAGYIVLTSFPVRAAQFSVTADRLGRARGVACYIMGYSAELLGDIDEAAGYYERSVRADGSSGVVRMRLAAAYAQLERFPAAQREVQKAVGLDPDDLGAHYLLALLYSRQKEDDQASIEYERIFKTLAARNPGNSEFPKYLGQLYYTNGKTAEAMEQFALALKLDPKNGEILYILGTHYLDTSRREEGLALVRQCLVLEPANVDCLNSLAYAYAQDNVNLDEGLKHVNAALAAEPDNPAFLDTRGWLYYRQNHYEEALKELIRADALLKDPEILGHIAEVYLKIGSSAQAREYQRQKEQMIDARNKKVR